MDIASSHAPTTEHSGQKQPADKSRLTAFISHASADAAAASLVCAALERDGIGCWIAPRDIAPGASWGEAIVEAIARTRLMVVLLSAVSNDSPQVAREVTCAADRGLSLVPVRLAQVKPRGSMEYFLGAQQWLDAFPAFERHLPDLTRTVARLLAVDARGIEHPNARAAKGDLASSRVDEIPPDEWARPSGGSFRRLRSLLDDR